MPPQNSATNELLRRELCHASYTRETFVACSAPPGDEITSKRSGYIQRRKRPAKWFAKDMLLPPCYKTTSEEQDSAKEREVDHGRIYKLTGGYAGGGDSE
jgi:hypothetical protein